MDIYLFMFEIMELVLNWNIMSRFLSFLSVCILVVIMKVWVLGLVFVVVLLKVMMVVFVFNLIQVMVVFLLLNCFCKIFSVKFIIYFYCELVRIVIFVGMFKICVYDWLIKRCLI